MGKKKTYEVSEQHKRVDIFRTVQVPNSSTKSPYTNESFVGSNNNLENNNTNTNIQFSRPTNQNRNINVWSTSNPSVSNLNKINNNKSIFINKKKSNRKIILTISITCVIFLFIVTTIGLAVYYSIFHKDLKCAHECISNQYCLTNQNKTSSSCQCKQGYTNKSNTCEQTTCFMNYYPFTYLNTQDKNAPAPFESKFLKPLCCPNSNYLSASCCGVSLANTSLLQVSKRIIGGNTLAPGVFPWIVYVTQVYRVTGSNQQIQMIKNCSGTLLNEWHVLTAGHCVEVDRDIVNFNSEFNNVESIMRVYFGFTDKSIAFESNVIANYERRVKNIIVHPKYDPMYLLNDLAILKLDKPIYRSVNTDYLCLFDYDKQDALVSSLKMYTAGWGSISPNHLNLNYPNRINYVDAIVFPMSFCKYIYPGLKY
jgi:hypothetical protein